MSRRRAGSLLALAALAAACADPPVDVPTTRVEPGRFEITIPCFGELEPAQATPVQVPRAVREIQRVDWVAAEGEHVAADEVVLALDTDPLASRLRGAESKIRRLDLDIAIREKELERELRAIDGQLALLSRERADAERYALRDPELFSRQEIIDAELDLALLDTRIEHHEARKQRYRARAEAELEILRLERRTEEVRRRQVEEALAQVEIRAPHAGTFLPAVSWRNEKVRAGGTVWPGQEIGEISDLDQMEARVYVLESEASGLAEGLPVELRPHAHPDATLSGRITRVQPVANPIDRGSPIRYFELVVGLDPPEVALRPGGHVTGTIFVARENDALSVPNQALFHDGGRAAVLVVEEGELVEQAVQLGTRSLSRSVITAGLDAGAEIALARPAGVDAEAD